MEALTIPKFENETDEANWLYENREALSAAFHEAVQQGRVREGTLKRYQPVKIVICRSGQGRWQDPRLTGN